MTEKKPSPEALDFASLIAHQLQSPLNAISAALQSVLGEYTGPLLPRQRGSLETASARCDEAVAAVRRMLAIIRAQQGDVSDERPAALITVVRQVHTRFTSEAARHDIALEAETHAEDLHVALGEPALAEVLNALIHNALKYTPTHGRVLIYTAPGSTPDTVRVAVADSGIGVPEEDRQRIFQPFFRSGEARHSARPGVGLGLAFVQAVVTASGGTIDVRRAALGGAEFLVELPVVATESAAASRPAAEPAQRVVIIGGVSAGPKAAAKIIRLKPDTDVTVIDKGSVMAYAGCGLPYYVAGVVRDQKQLISSPAGVVRDFVFFRNVKNVHVMNETEVLAVDRPRKQVRVRHGLTGREEELPYDKLLLATGSRPVVPEGFDTTIKNVFTLHGVRDAEGIRTAMSESKARDVVIVGGGLLGIEMTEALVRKGGRVTIVEALPHILPWFDHEIAALVERHLEENGVRIVTNTPASGLQADSQGALQAVQAGKTTFPANLAILSMGVRPNVQLAEAAGLALGSTGALAVDEALQTSDPDIFAAGDCVETTHRVTAQPCYIPLGSTALKQARVAAVSLCGGTDRFPGVLGTCICKVFQFAVGRTGLGEEEARRHGFEVETVLAPGPDRAHYMPTAGMLLLKLIVDRKSRRLLGAQATGAAAVDKRIDVAAMAISGSMTVDDIAQSDLSYAPSYSTALDNIVTACNVARNKLDGVFRGLTPARVKQRMDRREDFVLVDVRTPHEYQQERLPHSQLMPLGALRARLSELPRDKDIVLFCDISLRGYEAALILNASGFERVYVMEGGLAMWPYEKVI